MPGQNGCPFCDISFLRAGTVLQNELCIFLQRPEEILIGSGLIVPRAHRETVFDLTVEEWRATFELLRGVREKLDHELHPDGYNVGWNCGSTAGQEIFHAHLHVIPRFKDEPLAGKGIRYWLKQEGNRRQGHPGA